MIQVFMNRVRERKDCTSVNLFRMPNSDIYKILVIYVKKALQSALAGMWYRELLIICFAIANKKTFTKLLPIVFKNRVPHLYQKLSWGILVFDRDHSSCHSIHRLLQILDRLTLRKIHLYRRPILSLINRASMLRLVQWVKIGMEKLHLSPKNCHWIEKLNYSDQ